MIQHPGQRTLQLRRIGTDRMPAAFAVWKRDDAVDIRGQRFTRVARRDQLGRVCRAVAGRDYGDIVPCSGAAILARVAQEGRRIRGFAGGPSP